MNIRSFIFLVVLGFFMASCDNNEKNYKSELNPVDLVNCLMGTDSEFSLSTGNTYPAIALPWAMNFWTPQTGNMGNGWAYTYDAHKIRGIKQTHQPSPWINDYGAFSLMAVEGKPEFREEERASWFSHKSENATPYYYSVYLADYDITVEVSPTDRAAAFRFTFPESDSSFILLDAFFKGSSVKIIPEERKITGYARNNSGGVPDNFHNYFVAVFDKDFEIIHSWNNQTLLPGSLEAEGEHVGAVVGFKTLKNEQVNVRIASSFISPAQALLNLERETSGLDFESIMENAYHQWNQELGKIQISGGQVRDQETFYSCLYRVLLFPRKFYEINENSEIVHYSPYNGKVLPGYMFTDNGFWDTFRAVFPFFTLMYPEMDARIMEGLINTYLESGWLPEWASPGHRDCMIGSNSASLITDAWMKGIRSFNVDTLYNAMKKNSMGNHPEIGSVGRYGADYYNSLGYIPYDVGINENTARTLEYAYADFCLWKLASDLGKPGKETELWKNRLLNYQKVFDPESGLMRGRNKDGSFQSPFNPLKWGDAFTEGNSLHYTWSVFHDISGLIDLMGGDEIFNQTLDMVFEMPPDFDCSYYGFPIHEIREMQIMNMGNYAHGNQPAQHMPYLYNYSGEPWKSQQHVREIMKKLYQATPDGYCGDEDNGQTSAWYVFSAMGFYPVCPGTNQYVFGSPLFDKVILHLPSGKDFEIRAENNSPDNVFIQSTQLNSKIIDRNYITHSEILKGGILKFTLNSSADTLRGISPEARPYSFSTEKEE